MQPHDITPTQATFAQLVGLLNDASYDWRAGYRTALIEVGLLLIAESDRLEPRTHGASERVAPATTSSAVPPLPA